MSDGSPIPGASSPLAFTRTYNSRSDDRSALGSNWVHNWDVARAPEPGQHADVGNAVLPWH
ncbi:DUF6531 domain-containing protein [Edaphobacter aggregans]|uniref:DUF6531 domain-containing protein n=1 Tax=Edaphobacter aggregans TaxID=570835 RepID=UPI003CCBE890